LVGGSTRIPFVQQKVKEFFRRDPNRKVNPDEIVAMGAAAQGSIIKGDSKDILLLDVTPMSLGVKTFGGAFTRIINANTTIPVSRSLVFSTVEDNQAEVDIEVYQGEREIAEENKLLGKFTLLDIKRAPRGVPRIEVTFSININGIMNVSTIDLSTKNKKEILISQSGLLSKEEVERLREEAKKLSDVDLKKREAIFKKNKLINQIYSLNQLSRGSGLPGEIKGEIASLIREAEREVEKENVPAMEIIEKKMFELWEKVSTMTGGGEPPRAQIERTMDVDLNVQDKPDKGKKEDTKPLKITF
jgi:molecular chaperone DnaK